MVVDPVCGMSLDEARAAAGIDFEGERLYFCSAACHRRFLADPRAYRAGAGAPAIPVGPHCDASPRDKLRRAPASARTTASGIGLLAAATLLGVDFGVLSLVSGWSFAVQQFLDFWPFITALAVGFGVQAGLFTYLRRAVHAAASGKVVAATGTTSGAAMMSCCTHYLANLLPALGATGLVSFVGQYQVELFWFGLAANGAGIVYVGRRVVAFARGG